MNKSLLLISSINFDNATHIDNIRQTCIDLQADSINKEESQEYLQDSLAYLENPIQDELANELFQAILECFSQFPKSFLPIFVDIILKKSKLNSNYIIITSLILSHLTHVQPSLELPEYQSFVDESLTEILPQIQKEKNNDLTIFGHKISPLFKFDLIINLLLLSNKKEKLLSKFIPLIITENLFKNSHCLHQLFEEASNNGLFQILPQTENSIEELYEFITKQDIQLISKMNEASLSLIEFTSNFIITQKSIEKVDKSDFLPFLAVLFIILQKCKINKKFNGAFGSYSIVELIKTAVESATSKLTSLSIDFLVSNYMFFVNSEIAKYEEMLQIISFLLHQMYEGKYNGNSMILLFATFDLSHRFQEIEISTFFNKEEDELFEYIFSHLKEINDYKKYKESLPFLYHSLNLDCIDPACIISRFFELQKEEIIQGLHFIDNFFIQNLDLECFQNIEDLLLQILQMYVKEKNWDQLLYVVRFMEENQISENIEILQKMEIPDDIKSMIFRSTIKENVSIDDLITYILGDPHPENNEMIFDFLFNKLMEDKEICLSYLCYIFSKSWENAYSVKKFLTTFLNEYIKYKDVFIDAVNERFYFNKENMLLIKKPNFRLSSLPISDFGNSIILRLYNEVDKNQENFQAFVILKNIASSFPFLFLKNPQQVFDVVSPHLNNIELIYEKIIDEKQIRMIKTSFSALDFLYSTLQNTKIFDLFIKFVFTNISSFTIQQITCFFIIIDGTFDTHLSLTNISVWFDKYNVFDIIGDLLNKVDQNDPISSDFQRSVVLLLKSAFKKTDYTKYEIIQKEEFINLEFPLNYAFEFSFTTFIHARKELHFIFTHKHAILDSFVKNLQSKRKFWLSYNLFRERRKPPKASEVINFIDKLTIDNQLIPSYQIPKIPEILTVKMIRYLVMQSGAIYTYILFSDDTPLVQETFEMIFNAVEKLNEMNKEENKDDDDIDINLYNEDDFYSRIFNHPSFYKMLIHQLVLANSDSLLYLLLDSISIKNNCLGLILDSMSQELTNIYQKRVPQELINVIHSLVHLANKLRNLNNFMNLFFQQFGCNLLDLILIPEIRQDENTLIKVASLFSEIDSIFPIRMTHLIGFLLLINSPESISLAFKLLSKFEYKQFENIKDIVFNVFDNELNKTNSTSEILLYLKNCPSIANERFLVLFNILSVKLDEFSQSDEREGELFDLICTLFNILTPVRGKSTNLSDVVDENSTIPKSVMETSPKFWTLFEKHRKMINEMIKNRPIFLDNFRFLLSFPEVVSFKIRSSYFRIKRMEENRNKPRNKTLNVDRSNILESSFNSFQQLTLEEIINNGFRIHFEGEIGIDANGLRREWFTLLSKEIFNQKNALFYCSKKNKCYQPNHLSEVNPEHLNYFRFIGQFVALSLLENTCIDAHFTTSFCRMILHRDPSPSDIEDVDEELHKNMEWILNNDVDKLDLYFAIDVDKFGTIKTVPLIENGAEIKVTNENKRDFVALRSLYILKESIKDQIIAFSEGFDSLLPHNKIRFFTPNELGLLICGVPEIDVQDLKDNITLGHPFNKETHVIKLFFSAISKWSNENLVKLLIFITGSSSVPINGFKEFCEMSGSPIKIVPGGDKEKLPQAQTCFNILRLPEYENEEELNRKLLQAIQQCNTFEDY